MSKRTGGARLRWAGSPARTLSALGERTGVDAATVAGILALTGVGTGTAVRIWTNAPGGAPGVLVDHAGAVGAGGLLAAALAAGVLGTAARDPAVQVGCLLVGVFGTLALVAPAAVVVATGATCLGGALVVAGSLRHSDGVGNWSDAIRPRQIVGAVVLVGTTATLVAVTGVLPGLRPLGSTLALVGLAGAVLVGDAWRDPVAVGTGGLVAGLVVVAGLEMPFVTGAVVLVGFGVVGSSLAVVAAGLGGIAASAAGAARRRDVPVALGALTLLFAGVPASLPRAVAAVVGLALLVGTTGSGADGHPAGGDPS